MCGYDFNYDDCEIGQVDVIHGCTASWH